MSNIKEEEYEQLEEDKEEEKAIKQQIRLGFIRKVYGILFFQLVITTITIYFSITTTFFTDYLYPNMAYTIICILGLFITLIALICCIENSRKVPLNYVLLIIFTICESYLLSLTTRWFEPVSVLICAGITCGIVFTLTLYAIFTKTDLTLCGGTLASLSFISLILTIIGFFYPSLFYHTLINSFGLFLFSLYLIYDTQLVIGKNSKFISNDDYILGAIMIYLDLINIFLKVLWFLGKKKKK